MKISKDPIVIALGFNFVKYGLRKVDRDFLNTNS
jgi:hypothetical protein